MDEDPPRLSCPPDAHYAVRREAAWKRDVWRIASAQPRQTTLKRCARGSARRSPTPIIRDGARATVAPPAAATFSSSSASTAHPRPGTWPVLSSATCAWTTICRFATSAPRATSRRRASSATCSTKSSTRFDRSRRTSRSAATPPSGWRSFVACRVYTSRARNTADPTTGPSGAGIASERAKLPSRLRQTLRSLRPADLDLPRLRPADHSRAALGQRASGHHAPADHALADRRADRRRLDPRSRVNGLSRSTALIAPKGPKTYR